MSAPRLLRVASGKECALSIGDLGGLLSCDPGYQPGPKYHPTSLIVLVYPVWPRSELRGTLARLRALVVKGL